MSNLSVRKTNTTQPGAINQFDWNPFRFMRDMINWDPYQHGSPLAHTEERLFLAHFDVIEAKDCYIFKADLPGVRESDIEITLTGNRLMVTGRRELDEQHREDSFFVYERSYGTFRRAFTLPNDVDADRVHAALTDGVLTIRLQKRPELQPKRVLLEGTRSKVS